MGKLALSKEQLVNYRTLYNSTLSFIQNWTLRERKLVLSVEHLTQKQRALSWVVLKALKGDFPRSNAENKKSEKRKKPRNPIATPGNSYIGRSRLGDQARMRHISHHPGAAQSVDKTVLIFCFVS